MSYFPKHYITPNQYTPGGELAYKSSQIEYIGWYWKTGNGRFYTGRTPQSAETIELIPIPPINVGTFTETPDYTEKIQLANVGDGPLDYFTEVANLPILPDNITNYTNLKNLPKNNILKYIPQYSAPVPTAQDYQNGEFRRYFAKKTNELQYIETNLQTYTLLLQKSPTIEWSLYQPFNIPWQLTGDKNQVERTNRNIVELTIQKNRFYKFNEYLKFDYTKYYQFPNISNLYTAGGEFKTANGQNYIGFYHIHDKTGPMVGAVHTKEPHGLLFPINETIVSQVITQQQPQVTTQTTSSYTSPTITTGGGFSGGGGY